MNKQELIQEFKKVGIYRLDIFGTDIEGIPTKSAICLIEQLDEPQKVVVPQYIADKIEYCKESDGYNLFHAMDYSYNFKECASWLEFKDNIETFALAWIYGYEVEKEKRYWVKFKGLGHEFRVLKYNIFYNDWFTGSDRGDSSFKLHHTRKELEEAGFGWVFSCEGIEIEEVEE
jgi:hypothetical protein|nr:MAG TPA: Protein of unknown function (DUF1642) [Caudoviricetes sp.]